MTRIRHWLLMHRHWLVFAHDLIWVPVAVMAAYWIRFNLNAIPDYFERGIIELIAAGVPVHGLFFSLFGCYRGIWRFASIPDLLRIIKSVVTGALVTTVVAFLAARLEGIPRSILIIYPVVLAVGVSTSRVSYRIFKDRGLHFSPTIRDRALIVGAGRAGEILIRDLRRHGQFIPIALVDDDRTKRGHEVHGVRVRGRLSELPALIEHFQIGIVLIAMPSASREVMESVVKTCAAASVACRTVPSLGELAMGRVEVSRLRPVTVDDLLGREPIQLNQEAISGFLQHQCVLVTGGGGSIGSELCRQIALHEPTELIIIDRCEYNIYALERDLRLRFPGMKLRALLGDVRDGATVNQVFRRYRPQVVFHAAAYKHVPLVEENPIEGVRNNVFATKVVADAAHRYKAARFVLISTDKTVNPVNIMGVTKRIGEIYCQNLSRISTTRFITTRFGNVLASAGSVIPLFEKQIAAGGPVTVTHPEVTRYFMTIPEAVGLILQAATIGAGGEIFVLDMGQPIRIHDLAEKMIQLSGLRPERDIQIEFMGLRLGEKLHEELFYGEEVLRSTTHPKLLLAACCEVEWDTLTRRMQRLERTTRVGGHADILGALRAIVPQYTPTVNALEQLPHEGGERAIRVIK